MFDSCISVSVVFAHQLPSQCSLEVSRTGDCPVVDTGTAAGNGILAAQGLLREDLLRVRRASPESGFRHKALQELEVI